MKKPGRIPCAVPFCRRTGKDDGGVTEVICGKHYRVTNKTLRRRYRKACRRVEAFRGVDLGTTPADRRDEIEADFERIETMWAEIKRQAIEAAMGI